MFAVALPELNSPLGLDEQKDLSKRIRARNEFTWRCDAGRWDELSDIEDEPGNGHIAVAPQLLRTSRLVLHAVLDVCIERFRRPRRFRGNYSEYYSPPVDFSYFLQNRNSWLGSTRQALSGLTYDVDRTDFRPAWEVEKELLRTNARTDSTSWVHIEEPFWFNDCGKSVLLPDSCRSSVGEEQLKLFSDEIADDEAVFFKLASAADPDDDECDGEWYNDDLLRSTSEEGEEPPIRLPIFVFGQSRPLLCWASRRVQDSRALALSCVSRRPLDLRFASGRLRDDFEICRRAVAADPVALQFASENLRDCEDLLLACRCDRYRSGGSSANMQNTEEDRKAGAPYYHHWFRFASARLRSDVAFVESFVAALTASNGGQGQLFHEMLQHCGEAVTDCERIVERLILGNNWCCDWSSSAGGNKKKLHLMRSRRWSQGIIGYSNDYISSRYCLKFASERVRSLERMWTLCLGPPPLPSGKTREQLELEWEAERKSITWSSSPLVPKWKLLPGIAAELLAHAPDAIRDSNTVMELALDSDCYCVRFASARLQDDEIWVRHHVLSHNRNRMLQVNVKVEVATLKLNLTKILVKLAGVLMTSTGPCVSIAFARGICAEWGFCGGTHNFKSC
eukprot:g15889.t1